MRGLYMILSVSILNQILFSQLPSVVSRGMKKQCLSYFFINKMRKLSSYLPKTHNELSCEHGFNSSLNFPEANKVFPYNNTASVIITGDQVLLVILSFANVSLESDINRLGKFRIPTLVNTPKSFFCWETNMMEMCRVFFYIPLVENM